MDDDDFGLGAAQHNGGGNQANLSGSSTGSSSGQPDYAPTTHKGKQRQALAQGHSKRQQQMPQQRNSPSMQQHQHQLQQQQLMQQQQQQHLQQQQQQQSYGRGNSSNNYAQQQHQQQHQQQQQRASFSHSNHSNNSLPMDLDSPSHHDLASQSVAQAAAALEQVCDWLIDLPPLNISC